MVWKILVGLLLLSGCGTYRTGSGEYRGAGDLKTSSDYSTGTDSSQYNDERGSRERLAQPSPPYAPHGVFKLHWPVGQVQINRGYRPATDPAHAGLDLGGGKGVPILAAHEGLVIYAGSEFQGYGKMVMIEYDKEWATLYAHLTDFYVVENTVVSPGTKIGTMGDSGHATGVHLHFEVMHRREPVDPIPLLTKAAKFAGKKKAQAKKAF